MEIPPPDICLCALIAFVIVAGVCLRKKSRRVVRFFLVFFVVVAGVTSYQLTCTYWSAYVFGMGKGNLSDVKRWRERLAPLPDPDSARAAYPDIEVRRFPNGEWIFGVTKDSHASHWGGTLVFKESTGRVRAFVGHVCGPNFYTQRMWDAKSLAEFYADESWQVYGLQEIEG